MCGIYIADSEALDFAVWPWFGIGCAIAIVRAAVDHPD